MAYVGTNTQLAGWLPVFSVIKPDDSQAYLRIAGWTGRDGTPPTDFVGQYLGPTGYVERQADAVNLSTVSLETIEIAVEAALQESGGVEEQAVRDIVQGALDALTVGENRIAAGAVTEDKIGRSAVTSGKIDDDAVTGAKLADDSVGTDHIQDDAVTGAKIADGAVGSGQLGDDAVTKDKIADASVEGSHIAGDAVTSDKVADDAVGTDQLADNAVGTDQLAANAVDTANIADDAVTTNKLALHAVESDKIDNLAVTSGKIANDAVTSDKIADDAVDTDQVADNAIGTVQLADDAVDQNKIADDAVGTAQLRDNEVTEAKLADDSVGADQLRDDAVNRDKIADNAVGTAQVEDGAITRAKMAGGTPDTYLGYDADGNVAELAAPSGGGTPSNAVRGFRGTYSATETYNQGEIVATSAQRYWLCTTDGTIGQTPGQSEAQLWHPLSEYDGPWSAGEAPYPAGVIVLYNNELWFNTWANNSDQPGANTVNGQRWMMITGIADGAVDTAQLADDAVTGDKLADGAVTEAKLGDDAVTKDKIADHAVAFEHMEQRPADANKFWALDASGNTIAHDAPTVAVGVNPAQDLVNWASNTGTSIGYLELHSVATAAQIPAASALTSADDDKTLRIDFRVGVGSSATHRSEGWLEMPVSQFRAYPDVAANTTLANLAVAAMRQSKTINAIGGSSTTEAHLIVSKQNDRTLLFASSETSNLHLYSLRISVQSHRGVKGDTGAAGATGADGAGVPDGGDDGQILAKASDADQDTEWVNAPAGGGNANLSDTIDDETPSSTEGLTERAILGRFGDHRSENIAARAALPLITAEERQSLEDIAALFPQGYHSLWHGQYTIGRSVATTLMHMSFLGADVAWNDLSGWSGNTFGLNIGMNNHGTLTSTNPTFRLPGLAQDLQMELVSVYNGGWDYDNGLGGIRLAFTGTDNSNELTTLMNQVNDDVRVVLVDDDTNTIIAQALLNTGVVQDGNSSRQTWWIRGVVPSPYRDLHPVNPNYSPTGENGLRDINVSFYFLQSTAEVTLADLQGTSFGYSDGQLTSSQNNPYGMADATNSDVPGTVLFSDDTYSRNEYHVDEVRRDSANDRFYLSISPDHEVLGDAHLHSDLRVKIRLSNRTERDFLMTDATAEALSGGFQQWWWPDTSEPTTEAHFEVANRGMDVFFYRSATERTHAEITSAGQYKSFVKDTVAADAASASDDQGLVESKVRELITTIINGGYVVQVLEGLAGDNRLDASAIKGIADMTGLTEQQVTDLINTAVEEWARKNNVAKMPRSKIEDGAANSFLRYGSSGLIGQGALNVGAPLEGDGVSTALTVANSGIGEDQLAANSVSIGKLESNTDYANKLLGFNNLGIPTTVDQVEASEAEPVELVNWTSADGDVVNAHTSGLGNLPDEADFSRALTEADDGSTLWMRFVCIGGTETSYPAADEVSIPAKEFREATSNSAGDLLNAIGATGFRTSLRFNGVGGSGAAERDVVISKRSDSQILIAHTDAFSTRIVGFQAILQPHGVRGARGADGPPGQGVPSGGQEGQVLEKSADTDYATKWGWPASGTTSLTSDVLNAVRQLPSILPHANQPVIWSGKFTTGEQTHPVNAALKWRGFYEPHAGDTRDEMGAALDQPPLVGGRFTKPESQQSVSYGFDAAYFVEETNHTPSFFVGFNPDVSSSQTNLNFNEDLRVAVVDAEGTKVLDKPFSQAAFQDTGGRQLFWWQTTGTPLDGQAGRPFEVILYQSATEQDVASLHEIIYSPISSEYADSDAFYWKGDFTLRSNGIDTGYVNPQDTGYTHPALSSPDVPVQPINGVELFSDSAVGSSYTLLRAIANFAENRLEVGISPHDEDNLTLRDDVWFAIAVNGSVTFNKRLVWFTAHSSFWSYAIDPATDDPFDGTGDMALYIYRSPSALGTVNEIEQLRLTNIDHYLHERIEPYADRQDPDARMPRARLPQDLEVSQSYFQFPNVYNPEARQQVAGMLGTFQRGESPVVWRRTFIASTSGTHVGLFNDSQVLDGQDNEIAGSLLTATSPYNGRTYNLEIFRRDDPVVGGTDHELVTRFGGGNNGDVYHWANHQLENRIAIFNADQELIFNRQMRNGVEVSSSSNDLEHSLLNDDTDLAFVDGNRYTVMFYTGSVDLTAGRLLLGGDVINPLKTVSSSTRAGLSETRGLTEAAVAELFRRMVNPAVIREGWD